MSDDSLDQSPLPPPGEPQPSGKVLSNRTILICAVVVVLLAGAAGWLLLSLYGTGTSADQIRLDAIRTVGTIVLGAGGAIALLLAARRQQTAEQDLIEKRRDLAHKERVQLHAEQVQRHTEKVAADNYAHQQRVADASERDATERRITELYIKATEQLGSDKAPVRLAGLYALERLAQDNPAQRRTISKVICAYLRMPYTPPELDASMDASNEYRDLFQEREVRLAAQRVLSDHLYAGFDDNPSDAYWGPLNLDLTGATLLDFNLSNCQLGVGQFMRARFVKGSITGATFFRETRFDGWANFAEAQFDSVPTVFDDAQFAGEAVFHGARFVGEAYFRRISFTRAAFDEAEFIDSVSFEGARFDRAEFCKTQFTGNASFAKAHFSEYTFFDEVKFTRHANFADATFTQDAPLEVASWTWQASADKEPVE